MPRIEQIRTDNKYLSPSDSRTILYSMKKAAYTFILSLFLLVVNAQQRTTRLIVRGDDMGYSHAGNEALIKCYKEGIETSIEVIVPSPWFPEAVKLLKENPTVDVGVHLTITSEWDNVKWRPLSDCPSLRDVNGNFILISATSPGNQSIGFPSA